MRIESLKQNGKALEEIGKEFENYKKELEAEKEAAEKRKNLDDEEEVEGATLGDVEVNNGRGENIVKNFRLKKREKETTKN